MSPYRGPQFPRMSAQLATIAQTHGMTGTWRALVSAETANTSAYLAGAGITEHWRDVTISGMFALARGNAVWKQHQTPGGMIQAGDAFISTFQKLSDRDIVIWDGVRYNVDGDAMPIRMGDLVWYRAVLCRGDNV